MVQKILALSTQLDQVKTESEKYKRMWEDVKNRLKKSDPYQKYYQQVMMMPVYKGG